MFYLFFILSLFAPSFYNYIGAAGIIAYTILVASSFFLFRLKIQRSTLLLLIFVVAAFLVSYLATSFVSFSVFRVVTLPFIFIAGLSFFGLSFCGHHFKVLRAAQRLVLIGLVLSFFSLFISISSFLPASFASLSLLLQSFYSEGGAFTDQYVSSVRAVGFLGQPAQSAAFYGVFIYTLIFVYFLLRHLRSLAVFNSRIARAPFYDLFIVVAIFNFSLSSLLTVSRTQILSLVLTLLLIPFFRQLLRLRLTKTYRLILSIAASFLFIVVLYVKNLDLSSIGRLSTLSYFDTLLHRLQNYLLVFDAVPTHAFGFAFQDLLAKEINYRLYHADSLFAYLFSMIGLLGMFVYLYIVFFPRSVRFLLFSRLDMPYSQFPGFDLAAIQSYVLAYFSFLVFSSFLDPAYLSPKFCFFSSLPYVLALSIVKLSPVRPE